MKKCIAILLVLVLALSSLIGCAGQNASSGGEKPTPDRPAEGNTASPDTAPIADGLTLAEIRKAAEDSGFTVTDDYIASFMKEVTGGFSVEIVADDQDVVYSVLECKTEDAAISNAQEIDDAGYNIAIRNGRFMTCYGVDNKDGTAKDILASILSGKAV